MIIISNPMNVLDYCNATTEGSIKVDTNYQRTDKVWPEKAKQYLIETVILGYPIPKLFLHQKIDLKSKKSTKYIVDGQQRSKAIYDYFIGKFSLSNSSTNPELAGKKFNSLNEDYQNAFLSYPLPIDLFVQASREEIIETFRRINSYTVPLNAEEKRHANHQGVMKWFVYDLARKYSERLAVIGTFTDKNLSRMADFRFFSEVVVFLDSKEIVTMNSSQLDKLYAKYDPEFPNADYVNSKLEQAMSIVFGWNWLTGLNVVRTYIMQMIILSIANNLEHHALLSEDLIKENLSALSEAIETEDKDKFAKFVVATSKTTNEKSRKIVIYEYVTKALFNEPL